MKASEAILKRQKYNFRFKNDDMDFIFNWMIGISQIIGMSPAQVFYAVHDIRDGDPAGWREGFRRQGNFQLEPLKLANYIKRRIVFFGSLTNSLQRLAHAQNESCLNTHNTETAVNMSYFTCNSAGQIAEKINFSPS